MSADADLTGRIVLIVEDEAFIALDIEMMVEDFGGQVLGPFGHLDQALEAIENGGFDVALLDIMLGRDEVFPAAKLLQEKSLPFAFHSGHGIPLSSGVNTVMYQCFINRVAPNNWQRHCQSFATGMKPSDL